MARTCGLKVRIRECGENGARRRKPYVSYKYTKCDKFGHNALSCESTTQNTNDLEIKVTNTHNLTMYMMCHLCTIHNLSTFCFVLEETEKRTN